MSYPGAGYHSYKQQRVQQQQQQQQKSVSSARLVVVTELTHGLPTVMDLRPVNTEEAAGTEDRPRSVTVPTQVLLQGHLRQDRLPDSMVRHTVHLLDSMEEEEAMTHRLVSTEEEEDTAQESRLATRPATSSRCRILTRISISQSLTPLRARLTKRKQVILS